MFDTRWDERLDEAQLAAVTHGDGPLIVVAGAGTGKTRTLVSPGGCVDRPRRRPGTDPAADVHPAGRRRDVVPRCGDLDRRDAARKLWGGTFHAVAYRLVAAHAEALGQATSLSVLDPGDAARPDGPVAPRARPDRGSAAVPSRRHAARHLLPVGQHRATGPGCHRRAVPVVRPACGPRSWICSGRTSPASARSPCWTSTTCCWAGARCWPIRSWGRPWHGRWDHVLVDEYQDVNQIQVDIVSLLCPDGVGLTVVGDDAQAVYGFRGADSRHLLCLSAYLPRCADRVPGAELPVPATDSGARQRDPSLRWRCPAAVAVRARRRAATSSGPLP